MGRFSDQVAVVTGGGTGIGAAIAARFAQEGAKIVIAGRRADVLAAEAEKMGGAPRVRHLATDVSKPADIEALIGFAMAEFGRIDILVNNAGTGMLGKVTEVNPAVWHTLFATHVEAIFHGCRHAIPHLIKTGGSVINISSVSGTGGDYGFHAYNAAKAAIINLTRSLALDHARDGIRINCVSPGLIRTPATEQMGEQLFSRWASSVPMGRAGTSEEVAAVVAFLASKEASYVTGQNFVVDGGITSHTGQMNMLAAMGR